jgi:hypothetical protein
MAKASAQDTTGDLVRGAGSKDALSGRSRARVWGSPAAGLGHGRGASSSPSKKQNQVMCPVIWCASARSRSWAGRLPVDGHGVVAGVLPEQGLQRRCDVGAVLDQALRAGVGLPNFAPAPSLLRNQS